MPCSGDHFNGAGPTKRSREKLMRRGVQRMAVLQDARVITGTLSEAARNING